MRRLVNHHVAEALRRRHDQPPVEGQPARGRAAPPARLLVADGDRAGGLVEQSQHPLQLLGDGRPRLFLEPFLEHPRRADPAAGMDPDGEALRGLLDAALAAVARVAQQPHRPGRAQVVDRRPLDAGDRDGDGVLLLLDLVPDPVAVLGDELVDVGIRRPHRNRKPHRPVADPHGHAPGVAPPVYPDGEDPVADGHVAPDGAGADERVQSEDHAASCGRRRHASIPAGLAMPPAFCWILPMRLVDHIRGWIPGQSPESASAKPVRHARRPSAAWGDA